MKISAIQKINNLSDFTIEKPPSYPVVIPGAFNKTEAVRSWTPEYLATLLGSKEVQVGKSPDGVHRLDPKLGIPKGGEYSTTFGEYIKKITSTDEEAKTLYLQQLHIQDLMPELHNDIDIIINTFKEVVLGIVF